MLTQGGLVDSATDYLTSIAPRGHVFEWIDGELFLSSLDDDEDDF
jgi:hypothetical protein